MSETWIIRSDMTMDQLRYIVVEGVVVPQIGDAVEVIEKAAYDALKAKCADYERALHEIEGYERFDEQTPLAEIQWVRKRAREVLAKYRGSK